MEIERVDSMIELGATIAECAPEIEEILVLCRVKGTRRVRVLDNGLTPAQAVLIIESFKVDLLTQLNAPTSAE
jgi:hypothetical protein